MRRTLRSVPVLFVLPSAIGDNAWALIPLSAEYAGLREQQPLISPPAPSPFFAQCEGREGTGNGGGGQEGEERTKQENGKKKKINKTLVSRAGLERGRIHRSWPMAVPAGFQQARSRGRCCFFSRLLFFTGWACLFMRSERWAKSADGACWSPPASLELQQERQPASGLVPYSRFSPLNVALLFW